MFALRLFVFLLAVSFALSNNELIVITKSGPVQGILVGKRPVKAFLGIPYAKAPTGRLRFKPPEPVTPWKDNFLATEKSKSCIQGVAFDSNEDRPWWVPDAKDTSEDCLTLNIWVPNNLAGQKPSVIVYVYGGGFEGGTSASERLDGRVIASEGGVIFASMNYRTNVFGFLYTGTNGAPGNVGMMDQALALKWIRENIEAFGGNPDKITLMGLSAGGAAVNHHLAIPSSAGLFDRLIIQSGTSNNDWAYLNKASALEVTADVANAADCNPSVKNHRNVIKCLRNLDAYKLANITIAVGQKTPIKVKWAPTLDGKYLPMKPEEAFAQKNINRNVPVILGTTSDEAIFYAMIFGFIGARNDSFIDQENFNKAIKFFLRTNRDLLVETVQYVYTDWENPRNKEAIRDQLNRFLTDYYFLCKTNSMSDLLAENGNEVYRYLFSHYPSDSTLPRWAGSIHGDDINFVFGWALNASAGFSEKERQLSRHIIDYLTNFAKYGNPNGLGNCSCVSWPKYTETSRDHLNLNTMIGVGQVKDLRVRECAFWNNLYPKFQRFARSIL